jgi:GNAT superfamily N-acetyltransferase
MYIRRVDPADDAADLAAVLPVIRAAHAEFVPREPLPSGQRMRVLTGKTYQTTTVNFAAFAGDAGADADAGSEIDADAGIDAGAEAIGVMMGAHPESAPELLGAWSFIAPDFSGPEVSAALMEAFFAYCRERGIGRMVVNTAVNADAARYAPQRGSEPNFVGIRAGLDLRRVERPELASLSRPSAANDRYRIVHWVDTCPDELAEAYCLARAAMNDAPAVAENVTKPVHDLARMRGEEEASIRYGVRRMVTAALAPDGAIGGFTMTIVFPEQPEFAEIWDTGVAREHRGNGLGLRMKAAATLWLLREHPDARQLYTVTSRDNAPMRAVNERLGYRPAADWEIYEHEVPRRRTARQPVPEAKPNQSSNSGSPGRPARTDL